MFLFVNNTALIDTWRIVAPFSVCKLFIFRIEPRRNIFPDGTSHVDAETAAAKRNTFVQLRKKRLANRLKKTQNKTSKEKKKVLFSEKLSSTAREILNFCRFCKKKKLHKIIKTLKINFFCYIFYFGRGFTETRIGHFLISKHVLLFEMLIGSLILSQKIVIDFCESQFKRV